LGSASLRGAAARAIVSELVIHSAVQREPFKLLKGTTQDKKKSEPIVSDAKRNQGPRVDGGKCRAVVDELLEFAFAVNGRPVKAERETRVLELVRSGATAGLNAYRIETDMKKKPSIG